MKWSIIVHPKAVGEINQLPTDMKAKLTRLLDLIRQVGPLELREPHVKKLGNKLWEIRISGRDGISRVIYVILSQRKIGILYAFIKKTQNTPKQTIQCALRRLQEV